MNKEEFSYEVKDFEPTLKTGRLSLLLKVAAGLIICALLVIAGISLHRYNAKKNMSPEDTVREALSQAGSELYGKKSPAVKGLELEDWFDRVRDGVFSVKANLRIKDMKDFGLGFEKYANGIGMSVQGVTDAKNKKSSGNITGSWTVVGFNLLQYAFDTDTLYLSSKEFFKETIEIGRSAFSFTDMKISEIADRLPAQVFDEEKKNAIRSLPFADKTLKELLGSMEDFSDITKTGENRELSEGREKPVKCDCYRLVVDNELLVKPVTIDIYIDSKMRLQEVHAEYENGLSIKYDLRFTGEKTPVDRFNMELELNYGDDAVTGRLDGEVKVSDGKMTYELVGSLSVPGINLSGKGSFELNFGDGRFSGVFVGNDEVDEAKLTVSGNITKEHDNVKAEFESIEFDYADELIIKLSANLKLAEETQERPDLGSHPDVNIIKIEDFDMEDFEIIKAQVMKKINEYLDALEDFTFL